ncbi:hypothetical protein E1298_18830 [Actinomadura rubrisoli]|uniref:Uncharacterized protein n=1 Tax=Actinomadura rubrisoli TaxID=2530368 RepID=A0A4R5BHX3_9ACTN|nr:hypothetical protein E1298_18830 [Actinomadura rubrisoli]
MISYRPDVAKALCAMDQKRPSDHYTRDQARNEELLGFLPGELPKSLTIRLPSADNYTWDAYTRNER